MTYPATTKVYLIGKETTKGTAVTADKSVGRVQDINDELTKEIIESMSINSIETQSVNTGSEAQSHTVSMEYQHGRIFEFVIGEASHSLTSADTKHTFTVDDVPKGFSADSGENSATDVALHYAGCLIESCDISIALNENLKVNYTAKGMVYDSDATIGTKTEESLQVFPHSQCHVELATVEATEVQNWTMTFDKKLESSYGIGSTTVQQLEATELHFRFSGTLGFANNTYQELFQNATLSTVKFNAHNGITLGSGRRELSLTLSNAKFSKFAKAASIGGLIFIDVEGTGTLSELFTVDNIAEASWF